jgi:phosphoribosylanthranilate isomerase
VKRTRIKICGITREQDLASAANHGADAIGLNFYASSPRFVSVERGRELAAAVPPLVSIVALFVNAQAEEVERIIAAVRPHLLQFHGEETPAFCAGFDMPWVKAVRMGPAVDLLQYAYEYAGARALLLDAHVEGYGGSGVSFDWGLIPAQLPLPVILSGGLHAGNVAEAMRRVRPWAVDVSSGVESAEVDGKKTGIKDEAKIAAFCEGVRNADG